MLVDPRFHPAAGPFSLARLAEASGARAVGDESRQLHGIAPLAAAEPEAVSFLDGRRNLPALRASRAGAVVLSEAFLPSLPEGAAALVTPMPHLAFARIAALFHPAPDLVPGIHPTAVVAGDAEIGEGCEIGPYAIIGAGVRLGARCRVGTHAVIGPGCVFGDDCRLFPHASVSHCLAGNRVTLHQGSRVGQEGFGFTPTPEGRYVTIPQLGRVLLGDDVEVGANSCIDRGTMDDTVIGPGTRLDNLVQIGHNVVTGRGCVIVSQVGISGSTTLGDYVTLAGQAGLAGHIRVGSRARIGAQAGVLSDVPDGMDMMGTPAMPLRDSLRASVHLRKIGARGGKPATAQSGRNRPEDTD
ncbi:UDP-3-O-(3-hydroxymyristoyl)glucosamine N-acyltransferase [Roseomonas marmotae]|uniref:UDP-3-O-acylglucosamine N-acyltransferase n=1 Tax=Roseomonas marmotae TaxID=2768161 RepID=A0ABS3KA04_9PROT|nr:UDP-3-O-(3-hydroxymyristoyl)glucosamine N-acyltransferase [Roseomonas marmotae]MBO1074284.1 UDP-3-O-(3-hydroxymyristoyl)glucosamine N-acyltransferase [Roseomonas marmotae]QTI78038.1 UDP-3-O-(3-hydroxymyristoyl)glucosamine N-acyltransferase [Roseomonas marmotae]